jgi:tripartite ATP-independent transporter DctM subunit
MRSSSAVMLLIAGAFIINYAVTAERLDTALASWVSQLSLSKIAFLLVINLVFLLLGCILDTGTLLLVFVPILMPTVRLLEVDPVHFGVMIIVNIMIGLLTPPFGMLLFVLSSMAKVSIRDIVAEIWPFLIALMVALLVITLVPETVLWLPRRSGYGA